MSEMKGNKNNIIRRVVFCIALIIFVFSAYKLFAIWNEYRQNAKTYDEVREFAPEIKDDLSKANIEETPSKEKEFVFNSENYSKLLEMNNEFKGWLNIPGSEISYPLVQGKDNEYYLNHNFKKDSNSGGAIFITFDNEKPFEDKNTIIHGHHMKDGSMFASLSKFQEKDFFNNRKIYIYEKDNVLEYEVFSVYTEEANIESYKYKFTNDDQYLKYINSLKAKSIYSKDSLNINKDDKIVTLSTCAYDIEDGRLLVHGKLVNIKPYKK